MVRRRSESAAKVERVLEAAEALLLEHGYEAMCLKMIAKQSGLAIGSIVHLVGAKPVVAREVRRRIRDRVVAPIAEAIRGMGEGTPAEIIARVIAVTATSLEKEGKAVELIEALENVVPGVVPAMDRLSWRLAEALAVEPKLAGSRAGTARSAPHLYAVVFGPIFAEARLSTTEHGHRWTKGARGHLVAAAVAGLDLTSPEFGTPARAPRKETNRAELEGKRAPKRRSDSNRTAAAKQSLLSL